MEVTNLASEAQPIDTLSIQHQGKWLIQIKQGIHVDNSLAWPPIVCIFTFPKILLDLKRDAYVPRAISVGPCFHCYAHLSDMDTHKLRALHKMANTLHGRSSKIDFLLKEIEKMDGEIWDNYEKVINCNYETLNPSYEAESFQAV